MLSRRQQLKQLQLALINAFPSKSSLEQLLYYELEKNLNEITKDSDLQDIVFNLIQTAESQGWLEELIRAARKENPGNSDLEAIALELLSSKTSSVSKRSPNSSTTVVKPSVRQQEIEGSPNIASKFDVFLAHNSQDKPQVREIAEELKRRDLNPWLDSEQIPPGRPFQDEIQKAISLVKSAAILIGSQGLGKWQRMELRSLVSKFVDKNIPVIPVLLPSVNEIPDNLSFLKEFNYVSFKRIDDENALHLLVWGITGLKPETIVKVIPQPSEVITQSAKYDLFISYVDADKAWVEGYLLDSFRQADIRFYSEAAFTLGVPRLKEFENAIQCSHRTLLIISPAYLVDNFSQFIDLLAQSYGLDTATWPVIPLILHPVKLPPRLAMLTHLDATEETQWSEVIERLCAELQRPVP